MSMDALKKGRRGRNNEPRDGVTAKERANTNTYIALGDEPGDKVKVIVEVKAAAEFESATEAGHGGGLGGQFFHAPHPTKLFVGLILRHRQSWCPAIPAAVVVMGHSGGGRRCGLLVVSVVVVVLRHDCDVCCAVDSKLRYRVNIAGRICVG